MSSKQALRSINIFLKISIAVLCLWYLYHEIFVKEKFAMLWTQFSKTDYNASKYFYMLITFLLVFVNWGLETGKWKFLITSIEEVSWMKAFKAVMSGISLSIFTPNRTGEFAARIFYLKSDHRIKGILISIIGSVSQLCVTMVAGSFCFSSFLIYHQKVNGIEVMLLSVLPLVLSSVCLLFYFNMDILRGLLLKIDRARKTRFYLNVFTLYTSKQLLHVLILSILRFLVFSVQYYLLLLFFEIHLSFIVSLMVTSSIFFVLAVIPTVALAELGIRGAVAIYFLNVYSTDELGILASSYSLWCINLAMPALSGLLFLPQLNFFTK